MSNETNKLCALLTSALVLLSVFVGSVAFSGAAVAATNTSITPSDGDAGASGVTYTADGQVELDNQDTLQFVDVNLGPADVSAVGADDVRVYVDGDEYTDGLTEFSTSDGTVEFKLQNSRSISDGDRIRVVVDDVTNPSDGFDASATFHDTGDQKFQEYVDSVSIDTPSDISYHDLQFDDGRASGNDTTITIGETLNVSATISNSGEQEGTYNASFEVDGSVLRYSNGTLAGMTNTTVSFQEGFDATGTRDVTIAGLPASQVTITGPLEIVGGSSSPDQVTAGTTVSNQKVSVEVDNVSQDGDTDSHYVEFPDTLADSLSVNSVAANATSVTSSPNLVDGYDSDGVTETVKFATSGDGGGDIALELTVDVSVGYPDAEATYNVDARTEDSSGETSTRDGVASISTETTLTISSYSTSNPSGRDVGVSFESDGQLANIGAEIVDNSGATVATLTEADFTETASGDTYTYDATETLSADGDYDVVLNTAEDDSGNDGADGQTESVRINTIPVAVEGGADDPNPVTPGTTVDNQQITLTVSGVSADGNTDQFFVELPNELASGLSVSSASVNGSASIAQSAELVDGYDGDGVDDTVRFQTDTDAGGTVPLNVTVDVSVDYPDAETTYEIDARVEDSDGDAAQQSGFTAITAGGFSTPTITDYSVTNPADRNVTVAFDSDEQLADVAAEIVDSDGTPVATLTEADFTETASGDGVRTHETTYTVANDGDYTATLTEAVDSDGNDGASGESGTVDVTILSVTIIGGSAGPDQVTAGTTVNNQKVSVEVDNVSQDGDTDSHYVKFPDALADSLSVNSVAANATSVTSSPNLVDGYDSDGVTDTVKFATSGDGDGDIALELTVDVSVGYPDAEATYNVDARTEDSETGTVTQQGVATIDADPSSDENTGDGDDSSTGDDNDSSIGDGGDPSTGDDDNDPSIGDDNDPSSGDDNDPSGDGDDPSIGDGDDPSGDDGDDSSSGDGDDPSIGDGDDSFVSDGSPSAPANATSGETITVSAVVENIGDRARTQTAEFRLDVEDDGFGDDDDVVISEEVTLDGGETQEVSFEVNTTSLEAGTYEHGVFTADDNATAELTVNEVGLQEQFDREDAVTGGQIEFQEIINVIKAFNSDDSGIEFQEVVDVISAFNDDQQWSSVSSDE